jgi:hypothetical protein
MICSYFLLIYILRENSEKNNIVLIKYSNNNLIFVMSVLFFGGNIDTVEIVEIVPKKVNYYYVDYVIYFM